MIKFQLAKPMLAAVAACAGSVALSSVVFADDAQDSKALKEQMRIMQQQMQEMQQKLQALSNKQQAAPPVAAAPAQGPAKPAASAEPKFDAFVKGFYGTLDVSVDDSTKGINDLAPAVHFDLNDPNNLNSGSHVRVDPATGLPVYKAGPVGRLGYEADLSTNKSVIGYRGSHKIPGSNVDFIYQIETQPAITSAPGASTSYTAQSNVTKAGIGYGDSFVGLSSNDWGKLKFGTTYTPYKKSTDRMNPFSGMLGDYAVIMGNSGGDNRVEFGTRIDHSVWYESPKFGGVFSFDALFSPGQNRTPDSLAQSSGSPDCNGGNVPGSGNLPIACDDGGYDNAFSVDLKFESGPIYVTAAWELHKSVNRNSDGVGSNSPIYAYYAGLGVDPATGFGTSPLLNWGGYSTFAGEYPGAAPAGSPEYNNDIGNETAYKLGVQYTFDFGLVLSGIVEDMRRSLPANLEFQNERQRSGFWFAASQDFSPKNNVSIGWGHAGRTPGDPGGQHNYNATNFNNQANMYTIAWKHRFDKNLYWYIDAADTVNDGNSHYDLGAGGRGVTTDCHDGTTQPFTDFSSAGPTTWGGCHVIGFSTGLNYKF
jgi:predicted porin